MPETITCMGISLHLSSKQEVQQAIAAATPEKAVRIATLNPEFMLEGQKNKAFAQSLASMTHCIIDGSGLYFTLSINHRLRHTPSHAPELYHGADLVQDLCAQYAEGSKSFFFLGGKPGVAEQAATAIRRRHPQIAIVGTDDGGSISANPTAVSERTAQLLKESKPDILLVGFGSPKQELWMTQAAKNLSIPVMIGVGGTLDFYSQKKRASKAFQSLHLEWLYRATTEPGHWKRAYRATMVYGFRALRWLISTR